MSLLRGALKGLSAIADTFVGPPSGPRILIYHQVGVTHGRQLEVPLEEFEWQLEWLLKERDIVDLSWALSHWQAPGSDRFVVITFDDGYESTFTKAFRRLKEGGIPFTVYLSTATVGGVSPYGDVMLSWSQLEDMYASGLVTIGGHTHDHTDLRTATVKEALAQFELSNREIEGHLGLSPQHFAYPWGYWSEQADPVVRTEYSSAVLGGQSLQRNDVFDPFMISRYPVQLADRRRWFVARLEGGLRLEEEVRRRMRGYRGP